MGFRSLRESLDTTTPGGKPVFHVFASIAEFERDAIPGRTMAGLEAARARGKKDGRKPTMDEKKRALASKLVSDREVPISEVCGAVGVSCPTLHRYLTPPPSTDLLTMSTPSRTGSESALLAVREEVQSVREGSWGSSELLGGRGFAIEFQEPR